MIPNNEKAVNILDETLIEGFDTAKEIASSKDNE